MGLWMWLLGCPDPSTGFTKLQPELLLTPAVIDFGEVIIGEPLTLELAVTNVGLATLHLDGLSVGGAGASAFVLGEYPAELAEDDTFAVPLTFTPTEVLPYVGELTVSSDSASGAAVVSLTGAGVPVPTPDIYVAESSLDCGYVSPPNSTFCRFYIENVGNAPLVYDRIVAAGSGAFTLEGNTSGEVAPGDSAPVFVTYTPTNESGDTSTFTVHSNDADEPELVVTVIGNGGGDGIYPVALITGPAGVEPMELVALDGSGSYDPDGDALVSYEWSVSEGAESAELTIATDGLSASLQPLAAGDYVVSLRVLDNDGVWSAVYDHSVAVVPVPDLYVEIRWDTDQADIDLHLAKDGAAFYSVPGDLSYCNEPDWGVSENGIDDPYYTLEDDDGRGPESLAIDTPSEGSYLVRAHYFNDYGDGDVVVTVSVWVRGAEEASWSQVLSRNEAWDVATVIWSSDPTLTYVVEETAEVYTPDHRACYE